MPAVARKPFRRVEADLDVQEYIGLNLFATHSTLVPGEMKACKNLNLFRGGYMKSRDGTSVLNGTSAAHKFPNLAILNGVMWDTGDKEYIIVQIQNSGGTNSEFRFCGVNGVSGTELEVQTLNNYGGGALTFSTASINPAQMFISNNRLYVFSEGGNLIIEYDGTQAVGSRFRGRYLGFVAPDQVNATPVVATAGTKKGRWTYGLEMVYRRSSADFASSGINRERQDGSLATVESGGAGTITVSGRAASFTAANNLPAGIATNSTTEGMCVRIWRSKNQFPDLSDPTRPIDAVGLDSELYPLELQTYDAFVAASYTYTDTDLSDNRAYDTTTTVEVATLTDYIGITRLPAGKCGTYHRDRIWVSGATAVDSTDSKVFYSAPAGTAYQEQYNALNIVNAESGDGQKTILLTGMERDLIVFKENKTLRIQDGDPLNKAETMDHQVGIKALKLGKFVTGLGVVAIVNDSGDLKIFGYDLKWSDLMGDLEISKKVRSFTSGIAGSVNGANFEYFNGRLFVVNGLTAECYVLHSEEGRGWSRYEFGNTGANLWGKIDFLFRFSGGTRLAEASRNSYIIEIDATATTTDVNQTDGTTVIIPCSWTTHKYQAEGGRTLLEYRHYSVVAELSQVLKGFPLVNGQNWPSGSTDNEAGRTAFIPEPLTYFTAETEYKLFLKPPRPIGNFLHFNFYTEAPCTIRAQRLNAVAYLGMLNPAFDPFGTLRFRPSGPPWAKPSTPKWQSRIGLSLGFDGGTTVRDDAGSGALPDSSSPDGVAHDHTWQNGTGGSVALLAAMFPGAGYRATGTGTNMGWRPATGTTFTGFEIMDGQDAGEYMCWKIVMNMLTAPGADFVVAQGGNGTNYWKILILGGGGNDRKVQFQVKRGANTKKWTQNTAALNAGAAKSGGDAYGYARWIISMIWRNDGYTTDDLFLFTDMSTASSFGGRRQAAMTTLTPSGTITTHAVFPEGNTATRDISLYQMESRAMTMAEAERFFRVMKNNESEPPPS